MLHSEDLLCLHAGREDRMSLSTVLTPLLYTHQDILYSVGIEERSQLNTHERIIYAGCPVLNSEYVFFLQVCRKYLLLYTLYIKHSLLNTHYSVLNTLGTQY